MSPLKGQWRSLEQLAQDATFLERAAQEFPALAQALAEPRDRRTAIKLMSAAFAMSGLGACDLGAPGGHLIPAVRQPPDIIPALPNFYSTASLVNGFAAGVVVKHNMGRPIKVEGNPNHPASLGATDVFAQAQLMEFYDPSRSWAISAQGFPSSMKGLEAAMSEQRGKLAQSHGAGFVILTGVVTSPTLGAQIDALLQKYPQARWLQWEPVSRANVIKGAALAYGAPVDAVPNLNNADVILAIDSDLLSSAPGHLRFAHDFAARRNPTRTQKMSRVYALESAPSLIGAAADHRFVAGPRGLGQIVAALGEAVLQNAHPSFAPAWLDAVVADLKGNQGRALIHVGPDQAPETHALAHAMNEALGARGSTLELIEPVAHKGGEDPAALANLVADMRAGKINSLLMIDVNPAYATPLAAEFTQALKAVEFSLTLAQTPNETSDASIWAVPMRHAWETWSDARAYDGTATIMQPQALPLYDAIDAHGVLELFASEERVSTLDIVQGHWKQRLGQDFDKGWREALSSGVVAGSGAAKAQATLRGDVAGLTPPAPTSDALTVLFRPDPHIWDGRYANNPWLQELPRPFTKLTWDNPLLISQKQARRLDLQNGDMARLAVGGASVTAPVWILPGVAEDCALAHLGFGRKTIGDVGAGAGFDFYPLMGQKGAVSLQKASGRMELASTEHHNMMFGEEGDYARHATLAEFNENQRFASAPEHNPHLYRWKPEGPAAWAMSIDLNACIGCNACVVACQAENNIPVVGKDQVLREREMHWLRIDRYYEGGAESPETFFQPVLCMHCEQAPCETVCPVGATVHDSEGLNVMVYNRCIGTRFCSNNCPYKVRRFNYYAFAQEEERPAQARNPDVTVRARGVMEKCTFCLQRIAEARIVADRENRPAGEVVTACQAACPSKAITFGNLASPDSEVAKRKQSPLDYALLADQNTHPRVTYEARVRNVNAAIGGRKND